MNSTMISVKQLSKSYILGKISFQALRGIELEIAKGEFTTIAGSSGSGKSTLLNLIGCLDRPTSGEIWLENVEVSKLSERQLNNLRLNTIGFVFQSFNLIPVLNVYENIELPLLIKKGISAEERKNRTNYFMECVGLGDKAKHRPSELSGGQCQRVAVARALVTKPKIVLADEPTANLDSKNGLEIIDLMHEINRKEGTTFIFSSHDPKIIQRADRTIYLQDGNIMKEEK